MIRQLKRRSLASRRKSEQKYINEFISSIEDQDMKDFYSCVHEVEITDELIDKLIAEGIDGITPTRNQLLVLRDEGFKYNTKRKTFVEDVEPI